MIKLTLNESKRKPWSWTKKNLKRAADIEAVLSELKEYWPMTIRHVFYRLISSDRINQKHWEKSDGERPNVYDILSPLMKWMRIHDKIPMESITDEHRILTEKVGFTDPEDFVMYQLGRLGKGYLRCNAQKQNRYVEVWIEKATLLHVVEPIADEFCRRVVVCKGYGSVTFQAQFYERAMEAIGYGQVPTVLYFGDWDPSGVNMIHAAMETIQEELGLTGVDFFRCGINPEHFSEIPADPVPLKPSDTRTKAFVQDHGETAYELDAFHPRRLQELVRESLIEVTDMQSYVEQLAMQNEDLGVIDAWRKDVADVAAEYAIHHGVVKV
ncbi:hypothetical protein [Desulfococcus sp.]|uniref:hypothetical protein n=1 Tax=Desulfococcus sp. TaxID=2025834 RepID=UPI0035942DD2